MIKDKLESTLYKSVKVFESKYKLRLKHAIERKDARGKMS